MTPLTILIDMDDTIENHTEAWIHYANRRFGTSVDPASVTTWDPSFAFPGVTHDDMYALLNEKEFYDHVVPLPGAVEALRSLRLDGHTLLIVTATASDIAPYKMERVLFRYFPFLSSADVIVTSDKGHIPGDLLIDDGPHNLEASSARGILFSAPHNRAYPAAAHGFLRVENWRELLPLLDAIAGSRKV